jgi:hypothetical protein
MPPVAARCPRLRRSWPTTFSWSNFPGLAGPGPRASNQHSTSAGVVVKRESNVVTDHRRPPSTEKLCHWIEARLRTHLNRGFPHSVYGTDHYCSGSVVIPELLLRLPHGRGVGIPIPTNPGREHFAVGKHQPFAGLATFSPRP